METFLKQLLIFDMTCPNELAHISTNPPNNLLHPREWGIDRYSLNFNWCKTNFLTTGVAWFFLELICCWLLLICDLMFCLTAKISLLLVVSCCVSLGMLTHDCCFWYCRSQMKGLKMISCLFVNFKELASICFGEHNVVWWEKNAVGKRAYCWWRHDRSSTKVKYDF